MLLTVIEESGDGFCNKSAATVSSMTEFWTSGYVVVVKNIFHTTSVVGMPESILLIFIHSAIRSNRSSSLWCSSEEGIAKGWELNCSSNSDNELTMLFLLERPIQTLNTFEKGGRVHFPYFVKERYERLGFGYDYFDKGESWRRENLSEGKRSQSLKIDDKVVEMILSCSNLKGPGL